MENLNESSKYVTNMRNMVKSSENLLGMASQLVGAVGGNELDQMVSGALSAASNLVAFASYFLSDGTVSLDAVKGNYTKLINATRNLKVDQVLNTNENTEIFVDPYESEYLPAEMMECAVKDPVITEGVNEDSNILPDDLYDDPDAVSSLNPDGTPVKFNNTPLDIDPFAARLFRNNSDLIDPPEVFNAVSDNGTSDEKEDVISDAVVDDVIDIIADDSADKSDEEVAAVQLPSDDFDVFANESKSIPKAVVTPKTENILPPQFNVMTANDNIADVPGNNLKMLSFLTQDW